VIRAIPWLIKELFLKLLASFELRRLQRRVERIKRKHEMFSGGFSEFAVMDELYEISRLEKYLARDLRAEYLTKLILERRKNSEETAEPAPEPREPDWDYESPKLESYLMDYAGISSNPDLAAGYTCILGSSVEWMGYQYMPIYIKICADRVSFDLMKKRTMSKADFILNPEEKPRLKAFELPRPAGERYVEFEQDGARWRLDCQDMALRLCPELQEDAEKKILIPKACLGVGETLEDLKKRTEELSRLEQAPVAALLEEAVLWIRREYAEEHLSPECLAYSYQNDADGYCWCVADGAFLTVWHEIPFAGEHKIYMDEGDRLFNSMKEPEELYLYGKSYYQAKLET